MEAAARKRMFHVVKSLYDTAGRPTDGIPGRVLAQRGNSAFADDGAFVHVGRGAILEKPIHLLFVSRAYSVPTMIHPRNLLLFEEESQATVIEEYVSLGSSTMLCNSATELIACDSAMASHYMIEREHTEAFNISTLQIQQHRSANVASHSLLLGGGLVRNNVHPVLAGEGGECLINGLFIGDGGQHLSPNHAF